MNEPALDSSLAAPLLDAVDLFVLLKIPYALIGGVAAMIYGRARFTEDVDFVAAPGHESVLKAHADAMRAHHFDPSCTWKLHHDSGATVDIWKDEYAAGIAERAREVALAGRKVRVADVPDLIAMKLRARRFQDDYDVSEMLQRQPVHDAALQSLVTPEQFTHFIAIRERLARTSPDH